MTLRNLIILGSFLSNVYVFAIGFDEQLTSIKQSINVTTQGVPLGTDEWQYQVFGSGGTLENNGDLSVIWGDRFGFARNGPVELQSGHRLFFHYRLGFNSTGVPDEFKQDIRYGALSAGPVDYSSGAISWLLTDTRAYAIVQYLKPDGGYMANWIVPLAEREPLDVDDYTIVLNPDRPSITYLINGKVKMRVTGPYGIDPKFRGDFVDLGMNKLAHNDNEQKRWFMPVFTQSNFPVSLIDIIFISNAVFVDSLQSACMGGTYDYCRNTIAYAPDCNCTFNNQEIQFLDGAMWYGKVERMQIYYTEETEQCRLDDDSTNSSFQPWFQRGRAHFPFN